MNCLKKIAAAAGLAIAVFAAPPVFGASDQHEAINIDFSYEGPFGTFDRPQLQRGFQVYQEICAACHSLNLLYYRNLGDEGGPEYPEEQIKAFAAEALVVDGPDSEGEMFEREGKPSDAFVSPYRNEQEARLINGGALPPDLSLLAKARAGFHGTLNQFINGVGGAEFIYSVLVGYEEAPDDGEDHGTLSYNPYFPGQWIAMPQPLWGDDVFYEDGTEATLEQMSLDVSAFLMWAAEPKLEERKRTGFQVLLYLIVLTGLLYLVKRKIWANIKH